MNQSKNNAKTDQLETLLNRLYDLHPKLIDLSLDRMHRLLKALGNPHMNLPPVIHVAGTNGKGSTIAAMRAILEAHGKTCHIATSPHLKRVNERIVLAGKEIDDQTLFDLLTECMEVNAGAPITYFEMLMALTFLAFSRHDADYVLLETGLGGRFDASNVVHDPIACVIATISLDHKDFLGDSYEKIAGEKAGIMKHGVPCIIGKQTPQGIDDGVIDTLQSHALSTEAMLHVYGADWKVIPNVKGFTYSDSTMRFDLPAPALLGVHQYYNSGAAIAALRCINSLELVQEKISQGLGQMSWPARMQCIDTPRTQTLTEGRFTIYLDGGHNDSAGVIVADQIQTWITHNHEPVHVVIGMITSKEPQDFIAPFARMVASMTFIPVPNETSSFDPHDLKSAIAPLTSCQTHIAENVADAITAIKAAEAKNGTILICGSLYLAGAVLKTLEA